MHFVDGKRNEKSSFNFHESCGEKCDSRLVSINLQMSAQINTSIKNRQICSIWYTIQRTQVHFKVAPGKQNGKATSVLMIGKNQTEKVKVSDELSESYISVPILAKRTCVKIR